MPESQVQTDTTGPKEAERLGSAVEALWEKARRLSDILLHLRGENKALRKRVEELEQKEKQTSKELLRLQSNGSAMFTHEEKEALATRIKELIAKINSRL